VLHLRVIAPTELRDPVIDVLSGDPGVTHLVVHRDAAREPEGDAITADIARESANDVVGGLKALGVKERGAITLDFVDTVLSTRAYRAEDEAEGDPADAVVWDELAVRTLSAWCWPECSCCGCAGSPTDHRGVCDAGVRPL
jgi:hypothetical protein